MTRRPILFAALAALLAAVPAARAVADGDDGPQEIRIYDIGALVEGHSEFRGERGPYASQPDMVNDEQNPLFGFEGEEAYRPLGSVTDLVELLKSSEKPGTWEREGTSIAEMGSSRIVIKASAPVHERVAATFGRLQREILTTVVLDVVAVSGEPPSPGTGFSEAVASGAVRPIASARSSGFVGQRITAFHGGERAFLEDHDVEVAQNSKTSDPIVGIQKDGLSIDARVSRAADVVVLTLNAWLARVVDVPRREAGGDPLDLPVVDGRTARAEMRLEPGTWGWATTGGDVSFAVRATVRPYKDRGMEPASLRTSGEIAGDEGREMKERRFDVRDLAEKVENRRGRDLYLSPSNYTPPEPPELAEPEPLFPFDTLVELAKAVDPVAWDREGSRIDAKNGFLVARHDERRLAAVDRLLYDLRARYARLLHVTSRVVAVPAASLADWWADGEAADDAAALLARPGARTVDRVSTRVRDGQRMGSVGGVSHRYLGDWDVEIAEGVSIGNPIVHEFLEGTSLDVRVRRIVGGGAYTCEARFDRSSWKGVKDVTTRHGLLECPSVGLSRFRGSLLLKAGETRIVSAGLDGDEMLFILLTVAED